MSITVSIIADSTNWLNKRLTTFVLEYPRYIHSELMTHRVFSKNSASSRAIPIVKFIESIIVDPVIPKWTNNRAGMQGDLITDEFRINQANVHWIEARNHAITWAEILSDEGIHKQNVNRLLEPWMHMKIILTGTEFDNFFALRDHPMAMPEIALLASYMKEALGDSVPKLLQPGEWHIPFGDQMDFSNVVLGFNDHQSDKETINEVKLKVSVARCARVSYNNVDGTSSSIEKDLELYTKLVGSDPKHLSPTEHQARVPTAEELKCMACGWMIDPIAMQITGKYFSNLQGWIQYRKLVECGEA